MTSFPFGVGTRDASGNWKPEQARSLLAYTKRAGGKIAAAEFMNEPNYSAQGGAPKGYDAAAFGRDIAAFRPFFREAAPSALLVGSGSTEEGGVLGRTRPPAN